jgi:hypothetical protein
MDAKGQTFRNETIILDASSFENCTFLDCKFRYSGGPAPKILNCNFNKADWIFDGPAGNAITVLRALLSTNAEASKHYEQALEIYNVGAPSEADDDGKFSYLATHTTHAINIAKIAALFTTLEVQLCNVFAWMLQCYPPHAAGAYWQLQNNKARLDMLKGLIPYLHSEPEREAIKIIIQKAQESAVIRNRYCHALWQRKNDKLYITENLDTHYPHGTKRLVTTTEILSQADTVQQNLAEVGRIFVGLTKARPLTLAPGALKPSFPPKFFPQAQDRGQQSDPPPQSKSEEPEPPPQSSEGSGQ